MSTGTLKATQHVCIFTEGALGHLSKLKARDITRERWRVTSVVIALPLVLQEKPLCRL